LAELISERKGGSFYGDDWAILIVLQMISSY